VNVNISLMAPTRRTQFRDLEYSSAFRDRPGRRIRNLLRPIAWVWLFAFAWSARIQAYTFITNPPTVWPDGTVPMDLQLGYASWVLIDGNTSWNTVANNALATWNLYMNKVQFTVYAQSTGVAANGNGRNEVQFNSKVYGQSFGSGVLAITTTWVIGTRRTEGDTIFNSTVWWDSYRGNTRYSYGEPVFDLRRVALHEFGHVLGLAHPDQAGQFVNAVMNHSRPRGFEEMGWNFLRAPATRQG